jgi:diguanylate cyclase (GGDEF)-like protein/putative nucleotidyltransferase with HDIG domain
MARAAAWFYLTGAIVLLVSLALPHGPMDEPLLLGVALAQAVVGAGLVAAYDRLPLWTFNAGALAGTAGASLVIEAWGASSVVGALPYMWIAIFVYAFFALPAALAHTLLMGVGLAVVLGYQDLGYTPVADWVATMAALLLVGLVVAAMRDRLAVLIARLSDAARRDVTTGLLNRRGFEEAFDVELERARRGERPLSLVVGDLDRFKAVNDGFGHAAGDEALRRIGRLIASDKRTFDSAARVGGEEFALLAADTDEHGAFMLAERVRGDVASAFGDGSEIDLTISFGIASFPVHGESADSLLRAADQALYAAKRLGRNRSVISSAEVPGILARTPAPGDDSHVELTALLNLAEALDVRDSGSATHCHRVGRFAELTARELGLAPGAVERVRLAGILHDVGRVGMPDALLEKGEPLTDQEWAWVRAHPEVGARMLATTDFDDIRSWILLHHERPDGRGYPEGRRGEEVPLEARILGVADAYEAMTSKRPYREALPPERAAAELRRGAGTQWDGAVVEALLRAV